MPAYRCKWDKVYALGKRGNSILAPKKAKQLRWFDGMFSLLDPQDKGWTELPVFTESYLGEACVLELDRSWLPRLKSAGEVREPGMQPGHEDEYDPGKDPGFRSSEEYFDWNLVEPYVRAQYPDFLKDIHSHGKQIPVLKVPLMPQTVLKKSKDINPTAAVLPDIGQITSGSYTVGPVGADYPLYGGGGGAWAALGNFTGDLDFTLTGNIAELNAATCNINLNGFTLSHDSSSRHVGDPTAGWQISIAAGNAAHSAFTISTAGTGTVDFGYYRIYWTGTHYHALHYTINVSNCSAITILLHDLMLNGTHEQTAYAARGIFISDADPTCYIYNNVFWGFAVYGMSFVADSIQSWIENNAAYDCDVGYTGWSNIQYWSNNTAYDCWTFDYRWMDGAIGRQNRSSDASAADPNWVMPFGGNTTLAVALNDVQGVNPAAANFFDIIAGGPLDGVGRANFMARPVCIRNRPVPGPIWTSLGPAESPQPEPPPPPPESGFVQHVDRIATSSPEGIGIW